MVGSERAHGNDAASEIPQRHISHTPSPIWNEYLQQQYRLAIYRWRKL
jgi:hypothetical protein